MKIQNRGKTLRLIAKSVRVMIGGNSSSNKSQSRVKLSCYPFWPLSEGHSGGVVNRSFRTAQASHGTNAGPHYIKLLSVVAATQTARPR